MPTTAKTFCGFFVLLALAALAGDIYIWYNSDDHPFAFAAMGYLTKTYLPAYHQMVVDALTPEVFNEILTPLMAVPAFFLCLGLAMLSLAIGYVVSSVKSNSKGQLTPKNGSFKYNRR